jgi:hypothetical protein
MGNSLDVAAMASSSASFSGAPSLSLALRKLLTYAIHAPTKETGRTIAS